MSEIEAAELARLRENCTTISNNTLAAWARNEMQCRGIREMAAYTLFARDALEKARPAPSQSETCPMCGCNRKPRNDRD